LNSSSINSSLCSHLGKSTKNKSKVTNKIASTEVQRGGVHIAVAHILSVVSAFLGGKEKKRDYTLKGVD
jgi:hypothetical protein